MSSKSITHSTQRKDMFLTKQMWHSYCILVQPIKLLTCFCHRHDMLGGIQSSVASSSESNISAFALCTIAIRVDVGKASTIGGWDASWAIMQPYVEQTCFHTTIASKTCVLRHRSSLISAFLTARACLRANAQSRIKRCRHIAGANKRGDFGRSTFVLTVSGRIILKGELTEGE
jgi:hypothetical protein